MRYLLDTHVLLWLLAEPDKVPEPVLEALADPGAELWVSAVSALEISTKTRLGKLADVGLLEAWEPRLADIGARPMDITTAHCLLAGSMSWNHRDPFDRLLAAQGIIRDAVLVTVDKVFGTLSAPRLLTW